MPLLTALRQLTGDFGTVAPNQVFSVSEEEAESLESRGLAERYRVQSAKAAHANKMKTPHENK